MIIKVILISYINQYPYIQYNNEHVNINDGSHFGNIVFIYEFHSLYL